MARTVFKSALALALLLALLQLAYWLGVRRYFVSLADAVAPVAVLTFDRVSAFPPGELGLDAVRFTVAGRDEHALTADRLRARSGDLEWLARWLVGLDAGAPDALTIRLEGIRADEALVRQIRHRSDAVGFVLPFEGVGCGSGHTLTASDYVALGWDDGSMDVQIDLTHDPAARRLTIVLQTDRHPAGRVRAQMHFADVPEEGMVLAAGLGGARLERVEVEFDDRGALARRNAHCAIANDGVDRDDFIATHLKGVHDWLRMQGVVPDEPIWAAYRDWVAMGGPIQLIATPAQGVRLQDYGQFAPEDRLRLLGISARMAGGEPVPVEATAARPAGVAFRALPPLADIDPQQAFDPAPIVDADALVADDASIQSSTDVAESVPDTGTRGALSASAPQVVRPATDPAAGGSRVTTTYRVIGFPELAMSLGQRVRIDTVNGNQHRGVVLDATADAVELEIRRYGGGARLPIARDQISRIERAAGSQ